MQIGEILAACRKERGLSQMQLAERLTALGCEVSNQAVSKWEKDMTLPNRIDASVTRSSERIAAVSAAIPQALKPGILRAVRANISHIIGSMAKRKFSTSIFPPLQLLNCQIGFSDTFRTAFKTKLMCKSPRRNWYYQFHNLILFYDFIEVNSGQVISQHMLHFSQ